MNKYPMIFFIIIAFWIRCTLPTIQKTKEDSGTTVEMKKNRYLDVILVANRTTGYEWEIVNIDTTILVHTSTEYQSDEAPLGLLGTGGRSTFHFKSKNSGETLLKIIYHRSFEGNIPPVDTFELTVIIQS